MKSNAADSIRQLMQIRRDLPPPAERRVLRQQAGLSQAELAGAIGVSKTTIGNWETGARNPSGIYRTRYVEALREMRAHLEPVA